MFKFSIILRNIKWNRWTTYVYTCGFVGVWTAHLFTVVGLCVLGVLMGMGFSEGFECERTFN